MKTQLVTYICFFFILCSNALPLCSSETTSNMKSRCSELMMQDQHLKSKNDTIFEWNEEENQRSLKGVHEIIHAKRGVYGNSDILRRNPNARSGSSAVRPISILTTTPLGHVTFGLLVFSFFFSIV